MIKSLKTSVLLLFVCVSTTLMAQEQDVSDKELGQFADAFTEVQIQNQKSQQKMIAVIKEEGLEVERFNEIQQAVMDPNKESDATEAEKEKHENATIKLEKMQPEIEKEVIASIESTGISINDYESLAAKIQQDQGLQQRLQAIIVKRQGDKS
ncbi:hypothetical protein FNB79_11185 [Formosa sediminum]|uniref:DUF4168 domain-containing protein n=1 Tax=Formosa sediminum TaxID=2594004 RepID=A0A516GSM0_9FLAO|nr:DUF4168 domain-containing protein [Formosa sediminum]QDO94505.1 hypothetical protein FNB79_11185 [Formosa sediminum]